MGSSPETKSATTATPSMTMVAPPSAASRRPHRAEMACSTRAKSVTTEVSSRVTVARSPVASRTRRLRHPMMSRIRARRVAVAAFQTGTVRSTLQPLLSCSAPSRSGDAVGVLRVQTLPKPRATWAGEEPVGLPLIGLVLGAFSYGVVLGRNRAGVVDQGAVHRA